MFYRSLICICLAITTSALVVKADCCAEAITVGHSQSQVISPEQTQRALIAARLSQSGYALIADVRRKGYFVVLIASKDGMEWRLVVDSSTGEIIGKRPVSPMITVSQ